MNEEKRKRICTQWTERVQIEGTHVDVAVNGRMSLKDIREAARKELRRAHAAGETKYKTWAALMLIAPLLVGCMNAPLQPDPLACASAKYDLPIARALLRKAEAGVYDQEVGGVLSVRLMRRQVHITRQRIVEGCPR